MTNSLFSYCISHFKQFSQIPGVPEGWDLLGTLSTQLDDISVRKTFDTVVQLYTVQSHFAHRYSHRREGSIQLIRQEGGLKTRQTQVWVLIADTGYMSLHPKLSGVHRTDWQRIHCIRFFRFTPAFDERIGELLSVSPNLDFKEFTLTWGCTDGTELHGEVPTRLPAFLSSSANSAHNRPHSPNLSSFPRLSIIPTQHHSHPPQLASFHTFPN